jgi:ABC-type uncharacterized transport system fused permease/ATPase subunit
MARWTWLQAVTIKNQPFAMDINDNIYKLPSEFDSIVLEAATRGLTLDVNYSKSNDTWKIWMHRNAKIPKEVVGFPELELITDEHLKLILPQKNAVTDIETEPVNTPIKFDYIKTETITELPVIKPLSHDELVYQIHSSFSLKPDSLFISETKWKYLIRAVLTGQNLMITGPSGCGKTVSCYAVAKALSGEKM